MKFFLTWCLIFRVDFSYSIDLKNKDRYELSIQYFNYKYEEPGFMFNQGNKIGFEIAAYPLIASDYFLIGAVRYAVGNVDYTGSGTRKNNPDDLWEIRLGIGSDVVIDSFLIAPYLSLGYRTLFNDLRGQTSTRYFGYRRRSEYFYIPFGIFNYFNLSSHSFILTNLEYDFFLSGIQKSYLSDVLKKKSDLVNEQEEGYGFKISVSYQIIHWSIGLFFNYWNIGDSQISYFISDDKIELGLEPQNSTHEIGMVLKYFF